MAATIPESNGTDFNICFRGLLFSCCEFNIDMKGENVRDFICHEAEIKAQLMAEIRWLRNMVHGETGNV